MTVPSRPIRTFGRDVGNAVGLGVVICAGAINQIGPADVILQQESPHAGQDGFELGVITLERVDVDAHDAAPAVLVRAIHLIESGATLRNGTHQLAENHQDNVSFQVGQAHGLTVELGPLIVGAGLPIMPSWLRRPALNPFTVGLSDSLTNI